MHSHGMEMMAVGSLRPYERNARTHSKEQVAQICASIREFGWTNPLLVDEQGRVIAGHGRLMAAEELGAEHVPVIVVAGLSDTQKRALTLADNKLGLNAGWDESLLRQELFDLNTDEYSLELTGFGHDELTRLMGDNSPVAEAARDTKEKPLLLRWSKEKVTLTASEAAVLTEALNAHVSMNGSPAGFVRSLIGAN